MLTVGEERPFLWPLLPRRLILAKDLRKLG